MEDYREGMNEQEKQETNSNYGSYQSYSYGNYRNPEPSSSYREEAVKEKPRKKKKSHTGLIVLAAILMGLSLMVSLFFGLKYIVNKTVAERLQTTTETHLTRENPQPQEGVTKEAETLPSKNEEPGTSLTKSGQKIEAADTSKTAVAVDVSDIVEKVMPSVVAVTDNLEVSTNSNPYNYFFGYGDSKPSTQEMPASGSGVIIGQNESELLIVTNNHVVDNEGNYTTYSVASTGLTITFCDGSTASAVVKGTDSTMDLAVIAVNLSELSEETMNTIKIAVIGSSDEIRVGSGVIAIGNALGYGQSVTFGVVSAKDREVTIDDETRLLLQTDAAINPGNSGGGLFNLSGELIGINCAKYGGTNVEGMGFAIPITSSEAIIEDLMNQVVIPEEDQGYLGIMGETVPTSYISRYGYPEGVSITKITAGSPADEAGLQIYDIITAVDGRTVKSMDELKKQVQKHAAGETISITVKRPEGRSFSELEMDVKLVRYSDIELLDKAEEEARNGKKNRQ